MRDLLREEARRQGKVKILNAPRQLRELHGSSKRAVTTTAAAELNRELTEARDHTSVY